MEPNDRNPIELALDRDTILKIIGELYVNKLLLEQKIMELQMQVKVPSMPQGLELVK